MCEAGAYFVNNWIYGYQVYATHPTEYWMNPGGHILILIIIGLIIFFNYLILTNKMELKKQ